MTNIIRFRAAPVTTTEAKLNLFAPVDKIQKPEGYKIYTDVYEDEKCKISISGTRLTQIHRDILDIALFYGNSDVENHIIQRVPVRTFTLYEIQEHLQHKSRKNQAWLKEKFQDLKRATIIIRSKENKEDIEFNIIRAARYSNKIQGYVLVFEELYFSFFEKEIGVNYKALLPKILQLRYPQTKAVVRYLLSFSKGHQIGIDNILQKIGIMGGGRNIRIHKKNVLAELKKVGKKFNIKIVENDKEHGKISLKYKKHKKVKIFHPLKEPTSGII
jgi:hypothetical protein